MKALGTNMKIRIFSTWIGALLISLSVAQSAKGPSKGILSRWNFTPKQGDIQWTLMPRYGHMLVASDSALYSMDPLSGDVNWHSTEFGHVTRSSVHALDGDQFIRIDHAEWGPSIVSMADGTIPFKSKGSGIDEYQGSAAASDPCALFVWGSSRSGFGTLQ